MSDDHHQPVYFVFVSLLLTSLASASPVPGDRDLPEAPAAMRRRKLSFEAPGPGSPGAALRARLFAALRARGLFRTLNTGPRLSPGYYQQAEAQRVGAY